MENRRYKVCRDNIYVGEVVRTKYVYNKIFNRFLTTDENKLNIGLYRSYRSILFVPDKDNLADDLLYNSPHYPILNISDDEKCACVGDKIIVIKDAFNLSELLKYFGYQEELTYKDIIKIRKTVFSKKFIYNNSELFGCEQLKPEEMIFYKNGIEITEPQEIKRRILYYKKRELFGYTKFINVENHTLSREYWEILNERRNRTLLEMCTDYDKRLDVFTPHRHEDNIKKLIKK